MKKDPLTREREFRQKIENFAAAKRIAQSRRHRFLGWLRSLLSPLFKRMGKVVPVVTLASFGGLFLFIFGFSVKWTDAYACSLAEARQSQAVIAVLGEPIEAGFFAWIYGYSQQGSITDATFRTTLAGPKGEGNLRVQFYRSPLGSSLLMELETNGQTHPVYNGPVVCR